mgnify:FL=1
MNKEVSYAHQYLSRTETCFLNHRHFPRKCHSGLHSIKRTRQTVAACLVLNFSINPYTSAQLLFCLCSSLCACSRAFSASLYWRLKKASIPRYCATSPSSSQSPLPSGRPCVGIPPSAPLLLLSPTDPLRWARLGAPGAGRLKKWGRCHWQRPLAVPSFI